MKIVRKIIRKIKSTFVKQKKSQNEYKDSRVFFDNVEFFNSTIGEYSYIARNSIVHNTSIGKFCSIGPNVVIGYGDHPKHLLSTSPIFYSTKTAFDIKIENDIFFGHQTVIIGNDVWIGANVFIKNGLKIGNGAIIGAGTVVLKDVEPYDIVVGVPGIAKSKRFSESNIKKLLELEWWSWSSDEIMKNIDLLTSDEIIKKLDLLFEIKKNFQKNN